MVTRTNFYVEIKISVALLILVSDSTHLSVYEQGSNISLLQGILNYNSFLNKTVITLTCK